MKTENLKAYLVENFCWYKSVWNWKTPAKTVSE